MLRTYFDLLGNDTIKKKENKDAKPDKGGKKKKGNKGSASEKVPGLKLQNTNKATVEIFDDASPDVTPRDYEGDASDIDKTKELSYFAESHYRNLNFSNEQSRIKHGMDKFLTATFYTKEEIEEERRRLGRIEDSHKQRTKHLNFERQNRSGELKEDRAALKIQKSYRGHLGRRKFSLIYQIKKILKVDDPNDWIEVQDKETGDTWYYNKITNESQWEKPLVLQNQKVLSSTLPTLKSSTKKPSVSKAKRQLDKALEVSMSLPTLDAMKGIAVPMTAPISSPGTLTPARKKMMSKSMTDMKEELQIQKEIDNELGVTKLRKMEALTAPDGSFKPQLRNVVMDALLDTRFDSVATVLADTRWFEKNEELLPNLAQKKELEKVPLIESRLDVFRPPLVSVLNFNKKKMKRSAIQIENEAMEESKNPHLLTHNNQNEYEKDQILSAAELTLNNIDHTGFEDPISQQMMCFGCWSAGLNKHCSLHETGRKLKASETMLLCRNWELEVMKRRYRSEEIQEIFLKKESSLRYNPKYHRFYTVVEQKHPIYRMTSQLLDRYNSRFSLFSKIKFWLYSFVDEYRQGKIHPDSFELAKLLRVKRGLYHLKKIERFTTINRHLLPIAPITGYSWPERCHEVEYLYKYHEKVLQEEVDMIKIEPIPVPKILYEPREYHVPTPQTIPLLPYGHGDTISERVLPGNTFIDDLSPAAWLEKLCSSVTLDKIDLALMQIKAVTPLSNIDLKIKTKRPMPNSLKYATLGSKPVPGNLAVGGLPLEFLIYMIVSTYFPPQYGNFLVMDKSTVSPGVSPEVTISFDSILMPPTVQPYIERPLEHPLTYRRPPTITLNSNVTPDNKHFYGINRPEQTGEQESHGFRTTTWSPMLLTDMNIDPQVFVPGQGVVSLNTPKANTSSTTHADYTYPFCEPSTRDNSTLDFYHLLLTGVVSLAKAQIFTALSIQEPGDFQKGYRTDLPMGHLVVSVYRSWGFTQQDTIQEFKTDDGVSYWYHRKTGQTFWERPLFDDEDESPLEGGTVLDMQHPEEPTMMTKGGEGAARRYSQGEFRKTMLMHIETKKEALNRRKAAAATVKTARQRGVLPEPLGIASIVNNPNQSMDFGSKFDFNNSHESSIGANATSMNSTFQQPQQPSGHGLPPLPIASSRPQIPQSQPQFQLQPQSAPIIMNGTVNPNQYPGGSQFLASSNGDDSWINPQQIPVDQQAGYNQQFNYNPLNTPSNQSNILPSQVATQQNNTALGAMGGMMTGLGGGAGFDTGVINALSATLGQLFTTMMSADRTNPQDMIQLGMGMGLALMQTGAVQNLAGNQIQANQIPSIHETASLHSESESQSRGMMMNVTGMGHQNLAHQSDELSMSMHEPNDNQPRSVHSTAYNGPEPIGKIHPTVIFSTDKSLPHDEEFQQRQDVAQRFATPLNTMEIARQLKIEPDPGLTPDEQPPKLLTHEKHSNAEEEIRDQNTLPLVAYPELSTIIPGGAPDAYKLKPPAGLGTSYVTEEEKESQMKIAGTNLRRTVLPLPVGFFDAIQSKHVAKQAADYLPQVPNLPQSRTIGRVKPRSAAADWLMISFDPWSAGKNPLGTEYVPSLMAKAEKLLGTGAQAIEAMESLRQQAVSDAYVNVLDEEGLAQQKAEISKAQIMAQDFRKLCSLCRHSKFSEAEQLINQPDWAVPIDYQDDQGNALVHIAAQNGSKRLIKLCLRRGASLNLQNLNGQTALHFAYSYGYSDVGDYLVSKGADDSIRNKDGLTCYEGLGARELALL